jgi:hypothetical protein
VFRYHAIGFTGVSGISGETGSSAIVKSGVNNNISVIKGTTGVVFGGAIGYYYAVNIPSNDDIYHMTIVDKSPSVSTCAARLTITWQDTNFPGLFNTANFVGPTIAIGFLGSNTKTPTFTGINVMNPIGFNSNIVTYTIINPRILQIDIVWQQSFFAWYYINISF